MVANNVQCKDVEQIYEASEQSSLPRHTANFLITPLLRFL